MVNTNNQLLAQQQQLAAYSNAIANPDTQQALANLGIGPNVANMATQLSPTQLQGLSTIGQSFQDEFGVAQQPNFAMGMPLASQMPYNVMQPGMALASNMASLSPTYYGGAMQNMTMPQMLGQMQTQYPMGQQYMNQALAMPGMQQSLQYPMGMNMPGGAFGGLAGLNGAMGGMGNDMPAVQNSNVPGAGNLTQQQVQDEQAAALKKNMDQFNAALTLSSQIESAQHSVLMSIIQNIR